MGTLIANRFQSFGGGFSFWVFFNRLAFVFASEAINETSSPPVFTHICPFKDSKWCRS